MCNCSQIFVVEFRYLLADEASDDGRVFEGMTIFVVAESEALETNVMGTAKIYLGI